jgi:hypothetical protein
MALTDGKQFLLRNEAVARYDAAAKAGLYE